jgi:DNA-binding CsgD family transcriptional regulator
MTAATAAAPAGTSRLRIAITSPDILARVRQVFASKGLDVEIDRLPYLEVTVSRAAGAAAADPSAIGDALHRLLGAVPRATAAPSSRLCAEYRLTVLEAGAERRADRPGPAGQPSPAVQRTSVGRPVPAGPPVPAGWPVPAGRLGLALVPDSGAGDPAGTLSQRQCEVMTLVSRGVRNAEIAARLRVSEKTVKNHVNRIFSRLGASSRVEAVLIWQRRQHGPAVGAVG